MKIDAPWLREESLAGIFAAFNAAGYRAYLVGGAVRNAILGEAIGDLDLATDATPEQMSHLAKAAGMKAIPTGIDHGTMTLVASDVPFEITTFRRDVETDGRHATVAFTSDIKEDASRRDFTMNALYASADGEVIDPLGGLADALARRVRFIEDASQRIREDYLRILRFFRFHAQYGGNEGFDANALAAIADNLDGLDGLARERIGSEMMRMLGAPDPSPVVVTMAQVGALARVLPGADPRGLAPLIHLEGDAHVPPDAIRRLAALGGDGVRDALRLSKGDAARLDVLRGAVGGIDGAGALGYRHGATAARDILLLRAALLEQPLEPAELVAVDEGAKSVFPVTAADLMPDYAGAELGARLKMLQARWIASGFALTKDDLLKEGI